MSKRTCFLIFIISLITILASFVIKFSPITSEVTKIFSSMQSVYLSLSAVVIALLLSKQKYYWLMIIGIALIVAILIEWLVIGGAIMSMSILYKTFAFIVYAYLVRLVRFML